MRRHMRRCDAQAAATGFLGSVVLERLLSNVPTLSRITVIVRDKRGITGESL